MTFTATDIAKLLNGIIEGDKNAIVNGLSKIEEGTPGTLSFLANPKYTSYIYQSKASIVIVSKSFVAERTITPTLIRVDDPYSAFASLLEMYNQIKLNKSGIWELAFISPSARIGKEEYIGAFAYIGDNTCVGDKTKIYPQCYVGDNTSIGSKTTLFSGVKVY